MGRGRYVLLLWVETGIMVGAWAAGLDTLSVAAVLVLALTVLLVPHYNGVGTVNVASVLLGRPVALTKHGRESLDPTAASPAQRQAYRQAALLAGAMLVLLTVTTLA